MLLNFLIYRLAGFFSAFPIFLIPSWDVFYLNKIEKLQFETIHPAYTFSLGLAIPLNLFTVCFVYLVFILKRKLNFRDDFYYFAFFLSIAIYFLVSSQSLKSIAFSSSLVSAFIVVTFIKLAEGRAFIINHIRGLVFFIFAHAVSLTIDPYDFSKKTEGISIFSLEIYQSLISYPALIAALFGFFLLSPVTFWTIFKVKNKTILRILFATVVLIVLLYVETFLTRRASFVVIAVSTFLFLYGFLSKRIGGKNAFLLAIFCLASFVAFIRKFLFSGLKSFDFEHMILPRINLYVKVFYDAFSGDLREIFFGHKNDWAVSHNTYLDILVNSGIVGVILFIVCIMVLFRKYKNLVDSFLYRKNAHNLVIILFVFCLFFDNLVNCALSTPYYSVSLFIILTGVLFLNTDTTSKLSERF